MVSSLVTVTRRAEPNTDRSASCMFTPTSGSMTVAPVTTARSSKKALRRSPKYGAFTATALRIFRMELTTNACSGSPSTSSAIINTGLLDSTTFSSNGRKSGREEILLRTSNTSASSSSAFWESTSVMKYGDKNPFSNDTPSVTSR